MPQDRLPPAYSPHLPPETPMTQIRICVMAKTPEPGRVKTRLARSIGAVEAAAIATGLLLDTWRWVHGARGVRPVLILDPGRAPLPRLDPAPEIWDQGPGDLGDRLSQAFARALSEGCPGALAVGTDTVAVSPEVLEDAASSVASGRAVLGPTLDGGYYLLGLPSPWRPGLLAKIPWSSPRTRAVTEANLVAAGLEVDHLAPAFDVDEWEDLERLRVMLERAPHLAPRTAACLEALGPQRST